MNAIIYYSMACVTTVVINYTQIWNEKDESTLLRAKLRCGELYEKSPCLKKFTKFESTRYTALCSRENE